ncbi:hypothetical protein ACLOJK_028388 [Asimina triloba]
MCDEDVVLPVLCNEDAHVMLEEGSLLPDSIWVLLGSDGEGVLTALYGWVSSTVRWLRFRLQLLMGCARDGCGRRSKRAAAVVDHDAAMAEDGRRWPIGRHVCCRQSSMLLLIRMSEKMKETTLSMGVIFGDE